jgi:tetratricopeptide (TPR) repeat protein
MRTSISSHQLTWMPLILVGFLWSAFPAVAQPTIDDSAEQSNDDEKPAMNLVGWMAKYPEIAEAKDDFFAGRSEDALKKLAATVAKYPDLPPAELLLAELYFAANNQLGAVAALDRASVEYPDDPETYLVLGNFAFMQNRVTDAQVLFEKAAVLAKSFKADEARLERIRLRIYAGLASVQERRGDWEKAVPYLQQWSRKDPKNPAARLRLARALFRTKRGKEAYAEAQAASKLNEQFGAAPILIAQFYGEDGEDELAGTWLGEAEKRYGNDLHTRLKLAEWMWKRGDLEAAKRHAQAAYEIDSTSASAALMAGMIAHAEKDYTSAEKLIEEAHKAAPNDFGPRNHLAMVLAAQDETEKLNRALTLAQETQRSFPKNAVALSTLGWINYQLGNTAEARKSYEVAGSAGRGTGNMAYFFARFWADAGNKEQALNMLKQVLSNKTLFVFRQEAEQLVQELGN